mmetsp:Transcript_264/g.616  ORF Transcript_264/g.616 Transcript_264/m.616 type:complete len:225 (+) Transcript_264:1029-1703(+)
MGDGRGAAPRGIPHAVRGGWRRRNGAPRRRSRGTRASGGVAGRAVPRAVEPGGVREGGGDKDGGEAREVGGSVRDDGEPGRDRGRVAGCHDKARSRHGRQRERLCKRRSDSAGSDDGAGLVPRGHERRPRSLHGERLAPDPIVPPRRRRRGRVQLASRFDIRSRREALPGHQPGVPVQQGRDREGGGRAGFGEHAEFRGGRGRRRQRDAGDGRDVGDSAGEQQR